MVTNNTEIRVAGNGTIYVAPKGTIMPTTVATPMPVAWTDLGACTDDGASISRSVSQDMVSIWQSIAPARYLMTGMELEVNFTLLQVNEVSLPLYFGGGTVTPVGTAPNIVYTYNVPGTQDIDERALVIEAIDGPLTYRYCFPRAQLKKTDDLALKRTAATGLALTFGIMAPASSATPIVQVIHNDQNWT